MNLRTLYAALAVSTAVVVSPLSLAATAHAGGTIYGGFDVGAGGFQGNFNPLAATAGFTWLVTYFEPLVIYDSALQNIIGDLAESFTISPDQSTYRFKLANAKWHDGVPFTARDVKFTFDLAKDGRTGSIFSSGLKNIDSIETPDDHTVVIKLKTPTPALLDTLTKLMMLPQHALASIPLDKLSKNPWWSTHPIGTGPFKFSKYVTDQYVELVANPDYRGGKPKADKLINRYFADSAGAIAALRSGEIQFSYVDSNDLPTFEHDKAFRLIKGDSFVANFVGFNQDIPLWKDLRIRQAFMYAINRDAIIQSLYGGGAKKADCVYVADHLVPKDINKYPYDPEKAKQLLTEAGWDKINGNKPITILTYYDSPLIHNVLAAMQAMLAQVDVHIVPRVVDAPTYNSIVNKKDSNSADFPLTFAGRQNGPDPSSVDGALNEKAIPPMGANFTRVRMPALNEALDKALAETDMKKRTALYQNVCRVTNAQLPWATMWVANRYGVVSTKLKNFVWQPAPGGGPYQAYPEKWSISD
ncbi:ABC transporter substrate-binding protein [Bartonella sp. DGB2]|uniref:ABC transporter substrate-binding protein n=1 Tax=Bartonella sp. DGB2 TaxID=3388426 RepID=UPI00398FB41B